MAGPAAAGRIAAFRRRTQEFVAGCLREAGRQGRLQSVPSPEAGVVLSSGAIPAPRHRSVRGEGDKVAGKLSKGAWSALEAMLRGTGRKH